MCLCRTERRQSFISVCSSTFAKNGGFAHGTYLRNKESVISTIMRVKER